MSLTSLESLISFFMVLLLRNASYLFVTPTWVISIYLLKTAYCCFMWFLIIYVEVVRKRPWRGFLLNRFNLLIFNIIFTSNLARVLRSSSLWEFILVRLQAFGLWFYWKWAPTPMLLNLCCNVQIIDFAEHLWMAAPVSLYFQEVFF